MGIYGVNGVCHQSANLFLYAARTHLKLVNGRPNGLKESTSANGSYGTIKPFDVTHWLTWYSANYWRCSGQKDNLRAEADDREFVETQRLLDIARKRPKDVKVTDLSILIQGSVQGLDLGAIANLQASYLEEHEGFLRSYRPASPDANVIDMKSAELINTFSIQFQKALARLIGPNSYKELTGRSSDETVELIDLRILECAKKAAGLG